MPAGLPERLLTQDEPDGFPERWLTALAFLRCWIPVSATFASAPDFDYVSAKSQLERLNVTSMNAEVDSRLVSFMNNIRADAKTLASVISNRQKFSEDKFHNVKESFPIILASMAVYAQLQIGFGACRRGTAAVRRRPAFQTMAPPLGDRDPTPITAT